MLESGVALGRVRGIPIGLHWSWFLVFAFLTSSLANGYGGGPAGWVLAAVTSVLFFGSVLLHELGHAVVAQREKVPVRYISLFIFGGVAALGREAPSAGAEFRIAVAGPTVSFLLSAAFGAVSLAAAGTGVVSGPAGWLSTINGALAVFNLVPGYPLDGGRILRAALWKWTGNPHRATRIAARVGQGVALVFIGLGVLSLLRGDITGGIWMVIIGWFLRQAAAATAAQTPVQRVLRTVTVREVVAPAAAVEPGVPVSRLAERILSGGDRTFVVTDHGVPLGVVGVAEVAALPEAEWARTPAEAVMVPWERMSWVSPDEVAMEALVALEEAGGTQAPVMEDGRVLGILSRDAIVTYLRLRGDLEPEDRA